MKILQLLESSSRLLAGALPTVGSVNSVHSEIQQDSWHCEQDQQERGHETHSSILAWRIPMDREAWWATIHGVTKNQILLKQLSMHTLPHYDLIFYYIYKESISK